MRTRLGLLFALTFAAAACGGRPEARAAQEEEAPKAWHEGVRVSPAGLGGIRNSASFGEQVYFGGQPAAEDIRIAARKGVRTVVNLRTAVEMQRLPFDERAAVLEAGMRYVHIPIDGKNPPSKEKLGPLAELLDDPSNRPVLLHCRSSNRVGYAWAVVRGSSHGLKAKHALAEGRAAGLRSPRLEMAVANQLMETPKNREDRLK